jgi:hypothetical protein
MSDVWAAAGISAGGATVIGSKAHQNQDIPAVRPFCAATSASTPRVAVSATLGARQPVPIK